MWGRLLGNKRGGDPSKDQGGNLIALSTAVSSLSTLLTAAVKILRKIVDVPQKFRRNRIPTTGIVYSVGSSDERNW